MEVRLTNLQLEISQIKKKNENLRERSSFLQYRNRLLRSCFPSLPSLIECDFKFDRLVGRDNSCNYHPNRHLPYEELCDLVASSVRPRLGLRMSDVDGQVKCLDHEVSSSSSSSQHLGRQSTPRTNFVQ